MLLGSLIGNEILKPIIARPRPCHIYEMLPEMLVDIPKSYSFPSGHTTSSVISATVLIMANKKFSFFAVPLAFLIASVITLVWIAYTISTINTINRFVYDQELKIS